MMSRVLLIVALAACVCAGTCKPTAAPSTAPVFTNWVANLTEVVVQAGSPAQEANVLASWQMNGVQNRTAYTGNSITPLVADFSGLTLYTLDYYRICQFTCTIDENAPCDDQINGLSLCTYDQINRSAYVDEEEVDGVSTYHYLWQDPLAGISMASHELWVDTEKLMPVQWHANFHPFGTWQANVTVTYNDFSNTTPPAANFEFTGLQYCQQGDENQCGQSRKLLRKYMSMTKPLPKKIILSEQ